MTSIALYNPQQGHSAIASLWMQIKPLLMAGHRLEVTVKEGKRTNEQNRLLWACLSDLSEQVNWHGGKLSPEDWKNVLTASLKKQRSVPGVDGGLVVLGQSTSRMTRAEFSELIELVHAFGTEQGVRFKEDA